MLLSRNWASHGTTHRVQPPTLATDGDGYRYEAVARQRLASVLDPAGVAAAETAVAVLEPARFLQLPLRALRAGAPPAPALLAGLLADLDSDRVADAAAACWLIAGHR